MERGERGREKNHESKRVNTHGMCLPTPLNISSLAAVGKVQEGADLATADWLPMIKNLH